MLKSLNSWAILAISGYVESCNGNIRKELLNAYVFTAFEEVRGKAENGVWITIAQDHISRWDLFRQSNTFNPYSFTLKRKLYF